MGTVTNRPVNPLPAPDVDVRTVVAATSKLFVSVVATSPLLLVMLFPAPALITSTGRAGSIPLYSRIRMSGELTGAENVTVTMFALAAAPAMFAA